MPRKAEPYPAVPELEKLKAVQAKSQACGEFHDWLIQEKHFILGTYHQHTEGCYTMGFSPKEFRQEYKAKTRTQAFSSEETSLCSPAELARGRFNTPQCGYRQDQLVACTYTLEKLLAQFFEIDMTKVENEKRAILDWQRRQTGDQATAPPVLRPSS